MKHGYVLSSFQPAFPITSSFCPLRVLHIEHIFSRGIRSSIYLNHKVQAWLSFQLAHQTLHMGLILSPGDILYFSLGFLVFQCLSPIRKAYTTSSLYREAPFQWTTADIIVQSTQIPQPEVALSHFAGLALTCMFPQNMAPECCPQRSCMKPS